MSDNTIPTAAAAAEIKEIKGKISFAVSSESEEKDQDEGGEAPNAADSSLLNSSDVDLKLLYQHETSMGEMKTTDLDLKSGRNKGTKLASEEQFREIFKTLQSRLPQETSEAIGAEIAERVQEEQSNESNSKTSRKSMIDSLPLATVQLYEETVQNVKKRKQEKNEPFGAEILNFSSLIANFYSNKGDMVKAISIAEETLTDRKRELGEMHSDTLTSMNNLAYYNYQVGAWDKAILLGKESFEKLKETLGESHAETLNSMDKVAMYYQAKGDAEACISLGEESYKLHKIAHGEENIDTLRSMSNLASFYYYKDDKECLNKAVRLEVICSELRKKVLGENHPDALTSMNNLAAFYKKLGNFKQAIKLGEICLEKTKLLNGELHPSTLTAMSNLATFQYNEYASSSMPKTEGGGIDRIISLEEDCLKKREVALGLSHQSTLSSLCNLAFYCNRKGDVDRAISYGTDCFEKRCQVLGESHQLTLASMSNLSVYHKTKGNIAEAIRLQTKCLAIRSKDLGKSHPDTIATSRSLQSLINSQKGVKPQPNMTSDKPNETLGRLQRKLEEKKNRLKSDEVKAREGGDVKAAGSSSSGGGGLGSGDGSSAPSLSEEELIRLYVNSKQKNKNKK